MTELPYLTMTKVSEGGRRVASGWWWGPSAIVRVVVGSCIVIRFE
jgi:hypothetical protein